MIATLEYIERDGRKEAVLAELPPEEAALFSDIIMPTRWYSMDAYLKLLDTIVADYGSRDTKISRKLGANTIKSGLNTVYRTFLKIGNPRLSLIGSPLFWQMYFQGSDLEVVDISKQSATLKITGYAKTTRALCASQAGGIAQALQMTSAKNVVVRHTQCRVNGAAACIFELSWDI